MNLKHKIALPVIAACLYFNATSAHATVTLQFGVAGTARATGFSNSAGLAGITGMRWSVVIDTLGNGFSANQYQGGFDINSSGFLTVGGVVTDDYFVTNASVTGTAGTTTDTVTSTVDPGGPGSITSIANVPFGSVGSLNPLATISAGDPFAIIWFESNAAGSGNKYGFLENQLVTAQFDIPADSQTVSYASTFFLGADPIKPSNMTFQAPAGVPEPSRLMLLGLGGLGLVFRRRRC